MTNATIESLLSRYERAARAIATTAGSLQGDLIAEIEAVESLLVDALGITALERALRDRAQARRRALAAATCKGSL